MKRLDGLKVAKEIAKSKEGRRLSNTYVNSHKHLIFKCKVGHEWKASYKLLKDGRSWCPYCVWKNI